MKLESILALAVVLLVAGQTSVFGQAKAVGENASIELPAGWVTAEHEVMALIASNAQDTMSIVILQESGEVIEVANLSEFYDAKLTNMSTSLTDVKAAEKKEGEINGLKAAFTTVTAKIKKGDKLIDSKMYLMMYDGGKGDYYMAMIAASPRQFDANAADFMKVLRSFKMK